MFVVKDIINEDFYYCKTLERAKEIFSQIFMRWANRPSESVEFYTNEFTTWEELLEDCWNTNREWDDIVWCRKIVWEEEKTK
jgi:hypothetical protein